MNSQEYEETKNDINNEIAHNMKEFGVNVSHQKVLNVMMDSVVNGVQRHSLGTIPLLNESMDYDALSEHTSEGTNIGR